MQIRPQLPALVRMRPPNLLRSALLGAPRSWPGHLQFAWAILCKSGLPRQRARVLLHDSMTAAYECARSLGERVQTAQVYECQRNVKTAFARLSNCAKRAPADLRHLLDARVSSVLENGCVDIEIIESLVQTSRHVFEDFGDVEAAKTALCVMRSYREHGYDTVGLSADFSSLTSPLQQNYTSALSQAIKGGAGIGAVAVFEALANGASKASSPPRGATDIITDYVTVVANAWHRNGLRPARALKVNDPAYTSKFHVFCNVALSALVTPESRRHRGQLDHMSKAAWAHQKRLPLEDQKYVRGGLPRRDSQWLVTPHCLREGLQRANSKKPLRDSI